MEIAILALLVVAIVIGIVNIVMTKRSRTSGDGGGEIDNEALDIISENIFESNRESVDALRRDMDAMAKRLESAFTATSNANTQNWHILLKSITDNFAGLSEGQKSSLNDMVNTLNALIRSEHDNAEKQREYLAKFIDRLDARFKEISMALLTSLKEIREQNGVQLAEIRKSNEASLEQMRHTVDEKLTKTLNDRLEQSFNTISERLEAVHKGLGEMKVLSESVGSLNRVLNNAKVRGNWGEIALESLLEQLLSQEQYERQYRIEAKREAVDFAIRMPGRNKGERLYLPIDSKFPLDDYERMMDASERGNAGDLDVATRSLEATIKREAKSISEKYIVPPLTTDFAIMYLPIEGLFAEVVKRPGLCAELQNKYKVVVCGPTTITALLNSLQLGFKTLAVQEKSLEVWKALAVFKKDFALFADSIDKTKKKIGEASTSLEVATMRTDRIRKKLDSIENDTPTELIEEEGESSES